MNLLTPFILAVFTIGCRSVGATCSPQWKHFNGTCYMITDTTSESLHDAMLTCKQSYLHSKLLTAKDFEYLISILKQDEDNNIDIDKQYWINCPDQSTCWQWAGVTKNKCISISDGKINLASQDCSDAYVICRRPENIHRRSIRDKRGGHRGSGSRSSSGPRSPSSPSSHSGPGSPGSRSHGGSRTPSDSNSSDNDDDHTTTSSPLTTISMKPNSLSPEMSSNTFFIHDTATVNVPPLIATVTPTTNALVDTAELIRGEIDNQKSDPAAVFEACNDVLETIDANTPFEEIYKIIELCEEYALHVGETRDGNFGMSFNFEFLEVSINKSIDYFGGNFSYFSREGNEVKLNLREYSTNQDTANLTSVVALLIFNHESPINLFGKDDSTSLGSDLLVASFAVGGVKTSTKIDFGLETKKSIIPNDEHYSCAFWKSDQDQMYWSSYGCETFEGFGQIYCVCNHTTSFGVLVQTTEIPEKHKEPLSYITYIGCAFSLAALFITIMILMCIPSLNSTRIAIHKQFVVSLILAQVIFLVGPLGENKMVICQGITIAMHYLWLSVFFWMLMEGVHLYILVVKVYGSGKSYFRYYVAIAWGCPVVVVAITASLRWDDYESDSCYLSWENGMIWAFIGPAAAITFVNMLILVRVVCVVVDAVDAKSSKTTQSIAAAKGAIVLAPILGTTWIIGVFANLHIAGTYAFTIFNSLQGVFVFVFYCVRNSEVRNSIDRIREKRAINKSNEKNSSLTDMKLKISNLTSNKIGSVDNIAFQMN